jgi:hypothetical protein
MGFAGCRKNSDYDVVLKGRGFQPRRKYRKITFGIGRVFHQPVSAVPGMHLEASGGAAERGCGKSRRRSEKLTSGAKALTHFQ